MTKLHKLLGTALLAVTAGAGSALAQALPIVPLDVPTQQAQANAIIQQQNLGTQYNNLQLQQNLTQDRIREQQLFPPQPGFGAAPYGAGTVYGPPYYLPPPAPPPPKPQGQ